MLIVTYRMFVPDSIDSFILLKFFCCCHFSISAHIYLLLMLTFLATAAHAADLAYT